jgi:hypothetical protein
MVLMAVMVIKELLAAVDLEVILVMLEKLVNQVQMVSVVKVFVDQLA